jgi:cytochrome c oxidase subunit III
MTNSRTIDVSALPDHDLSSMAPLWWGQLLMGVIEVTMFLMLIAVYFYIRLSVDMWPLPGDQLPHVGAPTLALIPLLLSCFGSYWASEGAKKNSRRQMLTGLISNEVLGLIFLGFRAYAWHSFNFGWSTDIHGSIVWAFLFLHTLDAVADLGFTAVLIVIIAFGTYGAKQRLGVHVDSVVWYLIAGIWFPLYAVIYWGPHFVGAP